MKGVKILAFIIGMIAYTIDVYAQVSNNPIQPFSFDLDTWNFGQIEETNGKVNHIFSFVNISSSPQLIEHVKTTCGCTTISYPRQPIMPGKTGEIKVTFDPIKQGGRFQKYIQITTQGGKSIYNLRINGIVNPRTKQIDEQFPYRISAQGLQLDAIKANFGYIYHNKESKKIIHLVNTSQQKIEINITPKGKNIDKLHIDYPSTLNPGEKGNLTLSYFINSEEQLYGILKDKLEVSVKGISGFQEIDIEGTIVEVKRTDKNRPNMRYQPSFINFGKSTNTYPLTTEVDIYNDGKAPLIIRHIEYEGMTSSDLTPETILNPGKKKKVSIKFIPQPIKGEQRGKVMIISNDPARPLREITCKVNIN